MNPTSEYGFNYDGKKVAKAFQLMFPFILLSRVSFPSEISFHVVM